MDVKTHSRSMLVLEGILCIILGILAIALPLLTGYSLTIVLGWILIVGGIIHLYRTFRGVKTNSFWLALMNALLAIVVGILLLIYPLHGLMFLTLILGIFFFFEGITEIALAIHFRSVSPNWGWLLFSGILALILAFIIWYNWPITALWVIGVLLGINLIFFGIGLLFAATRRKVIPQNQ